MAYPSYLPDALDYIDRWLGYQQRTRSGLTGLSVALSHAGDIVYRNAFGMANIETQEKLTPDHLFRVASHSKSFTAVAIMQLVEAGKLALDDPASKYLSFLNDNPDKRVGTITIRQILSHGAGVMRDGKNPLHWRMRRDFPEREDIIQFFREEPLVLAPGNRFKYSNHAFALLSMIVRVCTGSTYSRHIRHHILKPLGLKHTGPDYTDKAGPFASGHTGILPDGTQIPLTPAVCTKSMAGVAGFYTDASDLCRFMSAIMPGTGLLLSDNSKAEMLRVCQYDSYDSKNRDYALGFMSRTLYEFKLYGHTGGFTGFLTETLSDPEDRLSVCVLTNSLEADPSALQKSIWHILRFFKTHYTDKSPYQPFSGRFYNMWMVPDFVPIGRFVYATNPGSAEPFINAPVLEHLEDSTFRIVQDSTYGSYGEDVSFVKGPCGRIRKVYYAGFRCLPEKEFLERMDTFRQKKV